MKSIGQEPEVWKDTWDKTTAENEIHRWDYFGGRQYISKYTPRYGKTVEAGSGLGRYVFYFSKLGIDIEGVDFSIKTIDYLNNWQKQNGFECKFIKGDVTNLPYSDSSLRGYISLGVVEHFIEGPQKPLDEAFRVLEPGGVAIITTPSVSWYVIYCRIKGKIKKCIKRILFRKIPKKVFFQYEYTPSQLKEHINKSGLFVTVFKGADLLFPFAQHGKFKGKNLQKGSFAYWFANKYENSRFSRFGTQSITISVKLADEMYCFLCGEKTAGRESLTDFTVPICKTCSQKEIASYYKHKHTTKFANSYLISPPIKTPTKEVCEISGLGYMSDKIFEDFGFNKKVSPSLIKDPNINIKLCNENLQPVWRNMKK